MNKKQNSLLRLCFSVALCIATLTVSADNATSASAAKSVQPVIGATVTVKGTNLATVTDVDGNFSFKVPAGSTLVITYVGYSPKEVAAKGTGLTIQLAQDEEVLNEVVVTALGMKKEAKSLSYNMQHLDGDAVTKVQDANFVNSLNGKVA